MAIFQWPVEANNTGKRQYLVRRTSFSDGYEQTSSEGINSYKKSWSISYSGRKEKVDEVIAFLNEHAGWKSFAWVDPEGQAGLYKASEYDITPYAKDVFKLTTTFEQAYGP